MSRPLLRRARRSTACWRRNGRIPHLRSTGTGTSPRPTARCLELYEGVGEELLKPPVNALRLSLHPRGIAPRIANLAEWRAHLLGRLHRQIELTADPVLEALMGELVALAPTKAMAAQAHSVLVPLQIRTSLGLLSFFSTTTVFGTPIEVTLSELAIELFFPADEPTAEALKRTSATGA